jgi:hypothetical protein
MRRNCCICGEYQTNVGMTFSERAFCHTCRDVAIEFYLSQNKEV